VINEHRLVMPIKDAVLKLFEFISQTKRASRKSMLKFIGTLMDPYQEYFYQTKVIKYERKWRFEQLLLIFF
jgi:hypothetical protein